MSRIHKTFLIHYFEKIFTNYIKITITINFLIMNLIIKIDELKIFSYNAVTYDNNF